MRNNAESYRSTDARQFGMRLGAMTLLLTSDFVFQDVKDVPVTHLFDPNGATRNVYLPPLGIGRGERFIVIANTGTVGTLTVRDGLGNFLVSLPMSAIGLFFGGHISWCWAVTLNAVSDLTGFTSELRQVTTAGAQVVSITEPGLIINKAVASATPVTLPLSASRIGRPIRLVDWRGNVDITNPLTVSLSGGEKIHNLTTWEFSSLVGGVILFPNTALGGYTIGA